MAVGKSCDISTKLNLRESKHFLHFLKGKGAPFLHNYCKFLLLSMHLKNPKKYIYKIKIFFVNNIVLSLLKYSLFQILTAHGT